MTEAIGKRRWVIAEGYIPEDDREEVGGLSSHETACIWNAGDQEASITITLYFSHRQPVGPYRLKIPPRRTSHIRFNDLENPAPVPRATDYASVIESNVPVVVQHTRIDARQREKALLSTIAFADGLAQSSLSPRPESNA